MKPSRLLSSLLTALGILLAATAFLALASCRGSHDREVNVSSGVFSKGSGSDAADDDLEAIRRSGELIVVTISSPTTYYDYHGIEMGLHYALAQDFASAEGVALRVVTVQDTDDLVETLVSGKADVIAYPLSADVIEQAGLVAAGYDHDGRWAVSTSSKALAKALDDWYSADRETTVSHSEQERFKQSRTVRRKAQAVYLSRDHGVISVYDNLFKEAAQTTGWDWRLIAAQCYQESSFDPNAQSYVGAKGLMQLMPKTAAELGVATSDIFLPEANIRAAARYIVKLSSTFSDVRDPNERIKFVLAAYNGGALHVRDAMALAKKYGRNPQRWSDVAPYILGLQQPRYYKDPVVRHGYMIGSETAGYVQSILERWRDYGGTVAVTHAPQLPDDAPAAHGATSQSNAPRAHRHTKYSSGARIMSPDDPEFNQMDD